MIRISITEFDESFSITGINAVYTLLGMTLILHELLQGNICLQYYILLE